MVNIWPLVDAMRDPKRISRILDKLCLLWSASPDQRLGQVLSNARGFVNSRRMNQSELFIIEDDEWEEYLDAALDRHDS